MLARALKNVAINMKPSPVRLIELPVEDLPVLVINTPAVPSIKAIIIFGLMRSPGKSIADSITTINAFVACIIADLTPAVFDNPI